MAASCVRATLIKRAGGRAAFRPARDLAAKPRRRCAGCCAWWSSKRHRQARRRAGLPRRRQDRHGREEWRPARYDAARRCSRPSSASFPINEPRYLVHDLGRRAAGQRADRIGFATGGWVAAPGGRAHRRAHGAAPRNPAGRRRIARNSPFFDGRFAEHRRGGKLRLTELMDGEEGRPSRLLAWRRSGHPRPDRRFAHGQARLSLRRPARRQADGRRLHRRARGARRGRRADRRSRRAPTRPAPAAGPRHRRPQSAPAPRAHGGALLRAAAGDHGGRHRHQRQDLGHGLRCARSGASSASARRASARIGIVAPGHRASRRADHARSGRRCTASSAMLARGGIDHVALEASSHGLDQFRLDGARASPPRPSPTSPATISTITPTWKPISRPRRGCSPSCCRRAAPPCSTPTAPRPTRLAGSAAARPDGLTYGAAPAPNLRLVRRAPDGHRPAHRARGVRRCSAALCCR